MKRCGASASSFLLVVATLWANAARAQDLGTLGALFGGMMQQAQEGAAREAWSRHPGNDRHCLQRALAARGYDFAGVIRAGVMPNDPRLASLSAQCRRFDEASLRRNYACSVRDEGGWTVASTCNQSFARPGGGGNDQTLSVRDAIDLHFSGTPVSLVDVETDGARAERRTRQETAQRAQQVASLRGQIDTHQRSPSPTVRAEAANLLARVERELSAGPGPAAPETLAREADRLTRLAEAETARLDALERLAPVKAQADGRSQGELPETLRARLRALQAEYASVSAPPRPASPPKVATSGANPIGPGFDCGKVITPLPQIICGDPGLRRIDLETVRPYHTLRHLFPANLDALRAEANEHSERVASACKLSGKGRPSLDVARSAAPCIVAAYRKQKDAWTRRAEEVGSAGARQELARPIQEHVRLQEALRDAGLLSVEVTSFGVYGPDTRRAIASLQNSDGLSPDGFMSDATADQLIRRVGQAPSTSEPAVDPGLVRRIDGLRERYAAYLGDLASFERQREAKRAQEEQARRDAEVVQARLRQQRAEAERLLSQPMPQAQREELDALLREVQNPQGATGVEALRLIERKAAEAIVKAQQVQGARAALDARQREAEAFLAQQLPDAMKRGLRSLLDQADEVKRTADAAGSINRVDVELTRAVEEVRGVLAAQAKLAERRGEVERLLAQPIPEDLRATLREWLVQIDGAASTPVEALARFEREFAQARPRLEKAQQVGRAVTARNRFVVEGDPQDILLLFNASPMAPSVVRGLGGDVQFDPARTVACVLPAEITDRLTLRVMAATLKSLGAPLLLPMSRCAADRLQQYDVVALQRGPMSGQPTGAIVTLLSAIEAGLFETLAIVSGAELRNTAQAEALKLTEIESEVESGASGAFAVIAPSGSSRVLCRVITGDAESHERPLRAHGDRLAEELGGVPTSVTSSADGAFLAARRGQCGAIYAGVPDLKKITAALRRDNVPFRYLPVRIAPEEIEAEARTIAERKEVEERRRAEEEEARRRGTLAAERRTLVARLAQARAEAQDTLKAPLPADARAFLTSLVARTEAMDALELPGLKEIEAELTGMKGRLEEAGKLARALTPRSRTLVEGDRGDLVILYNSGGRAPSVVRNLRGELVFEDGRALACVFHAPIGDVFLNRQVREQVATVGARLSAPPAACEGRALDGQDLVIAERDRLLKEPVDRVVALMEAMNKGLFSPLVVLTSAELTAARQAEAARATEIETLVRSRGMDGFGVLALPTGSSVVCKVVGSNEEAHAAVLARMNDRLRDELPDAPTPAATSADGAFVSAKRGGCGAVYARGGDLVDLVQALERDGLPFRFVPVMVRPEDVNAADAAIRERKRAEAEREADLRREREDKQKLQDLKDNDCENQRRKQQEALRSQYGAMARAFEGALAAEMKDYLQGLLSNVPLKYPALAAYYTKLKEDRWEFMEVKTTTLDYGTSEFKGRPLETAFAESRIRLRNRVLGAYKDLCVVTGYIDDTEFGMAREMIGVLCEDGARELARYKQRQRFKSRWVVD